MTEQEQADQTSTSRISKFLRIQSARSCKQPVQIITACVITGDTKGKGRTNVVGVRSRPMSPASQFNFRFG